MAEELDIGSMIQPLEDSGIYFDQGYLCWGPHVIRSGVQYFMVYSRWPKSTGEAGWLTDSEIALAVADSPEGPYDHVDVLLKGRGPGFWDELMVHNPKIKCFDGKYYLYYISSRSGPTWGHIRDSQRIGVAVSENVRGPYLRMEEPILEPAPPIYNVAVNPGITRMSDGRYLVIVKGDITPRKPLEPMPQRVQAVGIGDSPLGPFKLMPKPAIDDIDTEDASVWYDKSRDRYFAVFHAHTYIGLIESADGENWHRAAHYKITDKKILKADGTVLHADQLERPSIFVEEGEPRLLCLGMVMKGKWCCLTLSLSTPNKQPEVCTRAR